MSLGQAQELTDDSALTNDVVKLLAGVRVFVEVEEDTSRHFLRLIFAMPGQQPIVAGALTLHPEIAFWLVTQLEGSGAEVDVERVAAE
jgi:hypothetical protein